MAGDGVRGENGIGAGAAHFLFGALFGGARGDVDARIQAFGGEQHEQVVGIGGQRGDQAAGVLDAHLVQGFVAGGIGGHRQHAGEHGALDALGADIHDHEGHAGVLQFGGGAAADASDSRR